MKEELKSGIVEFDLLVEQFENGGINFIELTSALWNKGYEEGKKQAYSQTPVSGLACKCGNKTFKHIHSNWIECTACNKINVLQA